MHLLGVTPCRRSTALVKKTTWNDIEKSSEFQTALGRLGQTIALSKKLAEVYEKTVCRFYNSAPKSGTTVNDVRHWLFARKATQMNICHQSITV